MTFWKLKIQSTFPGRDGKDNLRNEVVLSILKKTYIFIKFWLWKIIILLCMKTHYYWCCKCRSGELLPSVTKHSVCSHRDSFHDGSVNILAQRYEQIHIGSIICKYFREIFFRNRICWFCVTTYWNEGVVCTPDANLRFLIWQMLGNVICVSSNSMQCEIK